MKIRQNYEDKHLPLFFKPISCFSQKLCSSSMPLSFEFQNSKRENGIIVKYFIDFLDICSPWAEFVRLFYVTSSQNAVGTGRSAHKHSDEYCNNWSYNVSIYKFIIQNRYYIAEKQSPGLMMLSTPPSKLLKTCITTHLMLSKRVLLSKMNFPFGINKFFLEI